MKQKEIMQFEDFREELIVALEDIFTQMFDQKTVFKQTEDKEMCKICSYKQICHKE